jgi:NADH dehydrogenase/putative oxidoreductase
MPAIATKRESALADAPRVVIVGAGFGGLAAALGLRHARAQVTLIDRRNYHLFQPLLYQVATASLSPADIATPIRRVVRDQRNCRVVMGRVTGIDTAAREILIGERRLGFDYLVLATGAKHSYFGKDAWEPFAPGLKKIDDATAIRHRLLSTFERAEATVDDGERARLLTFVVVGGGPTGVELAGSIAELARHGMDGEFRTIDPRSARIVLVQSGPRLLPAMPERLSATARRDLERLGVEVLLESRVEHVDEAGVVVNGQRIATRSPIWAAGVAASEAGRWIGTERDPAGRIKVDANLAARGRDRIYAIGDTAACADGNGGTLPGLASVAKQQGIHVARVVRADIEGRLAPPPFRYVDLGSMATIGRSAAVVRLGRVQLAGTLA